MILRRLSDAFRKQDWFTVVIETLIVVLGVFLGIQLGNWNEVRHERQLEQGYLARLHDDFLRSVATADDNIARMERQYRLEGVMLDQLQQCHLDETARGDFELGIYLVGRLEPPPLVNDTIDELKATGRMQIIRDLDLRAAIAEALRQQKGNSEVLSYIIQRATPQITYIDRRVIFRQPDGGFGDVAETGLPEGTAQYDFDAMCHDSAYLAAISSLREMTRVVISHNRARRADYLEIIDRLEQGREEA